MKEIVIKKTVSLSFLGEDYKDAYLKFKSVPIQDYDKITSKLAKTKTNVQTTNAVVQILQDYFIEGKFPGSNSELESVLKEDLPKFDEETITYCYKIITGQDSDPK